MIFFHKVWNYNIWSICVDSRSTITNSWLSFLIFDEYAAFQSPSFHEFCVFSLDHWTKILFFFCNPLTITLLFFVILKRKLSRVFKQSFNQNHVFSRSFNKNHVFQWFFNKNHCVILIFSDYVINLVFFLRCFKEICVAP